ncbi:MAG: C45 family autoproteolytic acyltransferase/hydrolase [Phycisphaerales bacterium]|jgi:hypothetical protein|nr:C45 family autoproteolytic acyltransferase/hydrolase [Phycisphaerales bacterium]
MHHLLLAIATLAPPAQPTEEVRGHIEHAGEARIVHVYGTPAEMGYAHGWLVGADFVRGIQQLFEILPPSTHGMVEVMRGWTPLISLSPAHREELSAMYRGLRDRVGEDGLILPGVERPLDETDLLLWNGYDMFRVVGCSGFTVWGAQTSDGAALTGRTLDLAVFSPHWVDTQILLVRHPTTGYATASLTPVCLLGAMTGINEHGVCAFLHDGDGPQMDAVLEPERPVMLAMLDILQQATPETAQEVARRELSSQGPFPFSYMVRVIDGNVSKDAPARTWHLGPDGTRPAKPGRSLTITTNHTTASGDEPPRLRVGDSYARYAMLHEACRPEQGLMDFDAAWKALALVEQDHRSFMTLHAIVVQPGSGAVQLCFAGTNERGQLRPAMNRPVTTLQLRDLFATKPPEATPTEATPPEATAPEATPTEAKPREEAGTEAKSHASFTPLPVAARENG